MRKLSSIVLIIVYGIFLVLMSLWWHQYYLTEAAGDWGFIFYIPYCIGGAFLSCFFLARLCFFLSKSNKIWEYFLYLLLILLIVYIPEGLGKALMSSYDDGYTTLFRNWSPWIEPLIRSNNTTRIILAESALGFSLGSFWQMRKEKKKQKNRSNNKKFFWRY